MARFMARSLLWLLTLPLRPYIRKVQGSAPSGPCVFACSHGSYLDGVLVGLALDPKIARPLIEEEWEKRFFIGWFLRLGQSLWVRTANPGAVIPEAVGVLRAGASIIIFPDGGLTDNVMMHPKTGAARIALLAGVPLVPLRLTNSHKILKRGLLPHFCRTDVIIGTPLDTTHFDKESPSDWRELTQKMAAAINDLH